MFIAKFLASSLLASRSPIRTVRRDGLIWELDLREGIDLSIYVFGAFQRRVIEVINKKLRPGDTFIDVGANRGAISAVLARRNPQCQVVAVEPTSECYRKLMRCIELNSPLLKNFFAHQVFLADSSCRVLPDSIGASWNLYRFRAEGNSIGAIGCTTGGAKVCSLDDFMASTGINKLSLLKLDVDGNEEDVLSGSIQTLERHRPLIVIEWASSVIAESGRSPRSMAHQLSDLGYTPMVIGSRSLRPLDWPTLLMPHRSQKSIDLLLESR